jgi:hypothetical protein
MLLYYFNLFGLEEIIAPRINREFGVVENIQLVLLVFIFLFALKGVRRREEKIEKYAFLAIAIFTLILFLEEIDYGLHYYDYFTGKHEMTKVVVFDNEVRNIHNNGSMQNIFKLVAYGVIIIFFVVFPFIPQSIKTKFPLLNFLSPSKYVVITAVCLLLLNQLALYFYHRYNSLTKALSGNVSEFEEIMIYYIILLYMGELVKKPQGMLTRRISN